jgi:tetratricopeptide (TPR) repeat protein
MVKSDANLFNKRACFILGLLLLVIVVAYSNTLNSSWHLDDYPNIVDNSELHLKDLYPASLIKTVYSHPWPTFNLYRPIACLTFALNWYFSQDRVAGYHIVNITIHLLTTVFLYLSILSLLRSPGLKGRYSGSKQNIALLAVALWALNPVQTQAITYIVQRMASMAAMFYIAGIYFYLKGRINPLRHRQVLFFLGFVLCYGLALGCKENAVTLPAGIVLVEIIFFQNLNSAAIRKFISAAMAGLVLLALVAVAVFYLGENPPSMLRGYENRSFTLVERLLTEPRILVFYLTQLFYPVPFRFSIEHDLTISTSLVDPWTTLLSILIIVFLIGFSVSQVRKRPLIAFGILFYFLNHIIESTLLPLELIFEHRNYLPSLFLFLPVAAGIMRILENYQAQNRSMYLVTVAFVILLSIGLGFGSYVRNLAWSTERTLWEDAMRKAPASARPAYNLAKHYYFKTGRLDEALKLYERSLTLKASRPKFSQALSLNAMASIYYIRQDYERVVALNQKALMINPGFETSRFNMILALAKLGKWEKAVEAADQMPVRHKDHSPFLFLKGSMLLKQKQPEKALPYFQRVLRIAPGDKKTLLNTGMSLSLMKQYKQADWFFRRALRVSPRDMRSYFYLIENSLKAGDLLKTEPYSTKLLASFSVDAILSELSKRPNNLFLVSASRAVITPAITAKLKEISIEMAQSGYR